MLEYTPPRLDIAPENGWLEDKSSRLPFRSLKLWRGELAVKNGAVGGTFSRMTPKN